MVGTIQTMEIGTISDSIKTKTSATSFAGVSGINKNNPISIQSGFVSYEFPQLVITPIIQPISLFFINSTFSNAFNIFHNNSISYINRGNYCLADFMITLSHEALLSSRKLFQESSGGSRAFRLQSCSQISEFGFNMFNLIGVEELLIGCNCNIVYSDIYPMKSVRNRWSNNVSGKSNMKIKNPPFINEFKSLVPPIKIFPIIFWNIYRNINSISGSESSQSNFIKTKCKKFSIERHSRILNGWFNLKFTRFTIFRR